MAGMFVSIGSPRPQKVCLSLRFTGTAGKIVASKAANLILLGDIYESTFLQNGLKWEHKGNTHVVTGAAQRTPLAAVCWANGAKVGTVVVVSVTASGS